MLALFRDNRDQVYMLDNNLPNMGNSRALFSFLVVSVSSWAYSCGSLCQKPRASS